MAGSLRKPTKSQVAPETTEVHHDLRYMRSPVSGIYLQFICPY